MGDIPFHSGYKKRVLKEVYLFFWICFSKCTHTKKKVKIQQMCHKKLWKSGETESHKKKKKVRELHEIRLLIVYFGRRDRKNGCGLSPPFFSICYLCILAMILAEL